jgi:hypothetical protein
MVCGWCALLTLGMAARGAWADNPNFPGYLGVYVVESNGGMQITSFIRDTPAAALAASGEINRGDTIVRLAGRNTRTLQQLLQARNSIPMDKEAKMVLRDRFGQAYYVWISRNEPTAAAAAPADTFRRGGAGEGSEGDFRDRPGGAAAPGNDGGPELRDKR